jgi:hypothetical protein
LTRIGSARLRISPPLGFRKFLADQPRAIQ